GRPALTAERFVPHPFSSAPGARLYRSGDRVCWREDGTLRFLGRVDFQVKVRGFRIELGEIEAVLREHSLVTEATVLVREDVPGDKRLVAYVVPAEPDTEATALVREDVPGDKRLVAHVVPAELDTTQLREHLRQRLPEYMVPSAFVALAAFPLSAHGKVDRKALPAPEAPSASTTEQVLPRSALEARLVSLWEQVLRRSPVGIHDNFFELGGHSLLATQLV
ncbi:AMP-binding enzyme, partial [Corallococcus llansteffanensis]